MKIVIFYFLLFFSVLGNAAIKIGENGGVYSTLTQQSCRAYGVNYIDVFQRLLENKRFYDYKVGFSELNSFAIPFVRFSAMGYWPKDSVLYFKNKNEYFRRMDLIFREAEKNKIGLIPTLFFNFSTVPDLMKEPVNAWADPNSKTTAFMKQYVREFLSRYSRSKALWGMEFSNERNLYTDLPNESKWRPKINTKKRTPATRTSQDSLSFSELQFALTSFVKEVRQYAPEILISSGHGLPRKYSYNNMKFNSWTLDSPSQMRYMLKAGIPAGVDLLSIHMYPHHRKKLAHFGKDGLVSYENILNYVQKVALKENKAVFLGEYGVFSKNNSRPSQVAEFNKMMQSIYNSGVSLSALWVYRFDYQKNSFDVRGKRSRSYQLYKIMEFNKKLDSNNELCKY